MEQYDSIGIKHGLGDGFEAEGYYWIKGCLTRKRSCKKTMRKNAKSSNPKMQHPGFGIRVDFENLDLLV